MTLEQVGIFAAFLGVMTIVVSLVFFATRRLLNSSYWFAIGLALIAAFLMLWVNLAVGIIGEPENPANLMYVGVLAIGVVGAIVSRFKPQAMARTLLTMAFAQGVVAMITLLNGLGAPTTPWQSLLVLNGVLITLWIGSAWVFKKTAHAS